ncbi:glycosyltransferase family 4 protein [Streptomyces sp. G45]|uniref:glycosyltransferase family 4 protein n=1 Tax=Streptomyces sp. G45 TaxID=3406627 RepID=UPI003C22065A
MKIAFLIHNAYGIGGTIRATANLSGALAAARHEVEVVSVHRVAEEPELPFDPRVRLHALIDMREDSPSYEGEHALTRRPNSMFPEKGVDFGRLRFTALHDRRIAAYLKATDADAVIATRPILNGYLARYGRPMRERGGYLRIGQEHLSLNAHSEQLRRDQNSATARGLDAFVTVSEADAAAYRAALPGVGARILCVPNGVSAPAVAPSRLDSRVIVAAGRLVAVKRYDRLVSAFAKVAAEYPDWTLRIYGRGPDRARLRRLIDELGLYDRAFLMGPVSPVETEWAKGAVAAVSSDMESFGMTIVEAMHCGVPVVATDCPHGPAEIITHGEDGLLVPLAGEVDAYADALKALIGDGGLRARLGAAARAKAATYAPSVIARRYEQLFESLLRTSPARPRLSTRLRRAVTGGPYRATPAPVPERATALPTAATAATAATASARVTADGSLAVVLAHRTLPRGPLDLLLRKRKDPERREVRLPVPPPVPVAPRVVETVATVRRAAHVLTEGRWDCYVTPSDHVTPSDKPADRHRLRAHLVETAALLTLPPVIAADGSVSSWIPYTTADGYLALRTWLRPAHAEVERVLVTEEGLTVTGLLLGAAELPPTGATATATRRTPAPPIPGGPTPPLAPDITVPLHPLPSPPPHPPLPVHAPLRRGPHPPRHGGPHHLGPPRPDPHDPRPPGPHHRRHPRPQKAQPLPPGAPPPPPHRPHPPQALLHNNERPIPQRPPRPTTCMTAPLFPAPPAPLPSHHERTRPAHRASPGTELYDGAADHGRSGGATAASSASEDKAGL